MKRKSSIDYENLEPPDHFSSRAEDGVNYIIGSRNRLPCLEEIASAIDEYKNSSASKNKFFPSNGKTIYIDIY